MFKSKLRQHAAFLLAASIFVGFSLSAADSISVHADNADCMPSLSAYATKDDLKSKFGPSGGNKGKLTFGKDESGNALKWHIIGSDSGVSGDNTIIFATSNIIEKDQVFNDDYSDSSTDYSGSKDPSKLVTYVDDGFTPGGGILELLWCKRPKRKAPELSS